MWCRRFVHPPTNEQVYCIMICSVLLYDRETLLLRLEDINKLLAFDYRPIWSTTCLCWEHRVSNAMVRRKVANLYRLWWFRYILPVSYHHLPWHTIMTCEEKCWKKGKGSQFRTSRRSMKSLIITLVHLGGWGLLSRGSRNYRE